MVLVSKDWYRYRFLGEVDFCAAGASSQSSTSVVFIKLLFLHIYNTSQLSAMKRSRFMTLFVFATHPHTDLLCPAALGVSAGSLRSSAAFPPFCCGCWSGSHGNLLGKSSDHRSVKMPLVHQHVEHVFISIARENNNHTDYVTALKRSFYAFFSFNVSDLAVFFVFFIISLDQTGESSSSHISAWRSPQKKGLIFLGDFRFAGFKD